MDGQRADVDGHLVSLDGIPMAQLLALDASDSPLAKSIRRVIDAARQHPQDTVAAFTNRI